MVTFFVDDADGRRGGEDRQLSQVETVTKDDSKKDTAICGGGADEGLSTRRISATESARREGEKCVRGFKGGNEMWRV